MNKIYFNPQPKPLPQAKKPKGKIAKQSKKMVTLRQKINAAKNKVRERDGMVCTSCPEKEGFIDCSHIISERECAGELEHLAYDTDNMVCQCRKCHLIWEAGDIEKIMKFRNLIHFRAMLETYQPERSAKLELKIEGFLIGRISNAA